MSDDLKRLVARGAKTMNGCDIFYDSVEGNDFLDYMKDLCIMVPDIAMRPIIGPTIPDLATMQKKQDLIKGFKTGVIVGDYPHPMERKIRPGCMENFNMENVSRELKSYCRFFNEFDPFVSSQPLFIIREPEFIKNCCQSIMSDMMNEKPWISHFNIDFKPKVPKVTITKDRRKRK